MNQALDSTVVVQDRDTALSTSLGAIPYIFFKAYVCMTV